MRRTFIACACSIAIAVSAAPSYTPLSIALSVGQWLTKDTKKVYYVQVEATADNLEAARQEALRSRYGSWYLCACRKRNS